MAIRQFVKFIVGDEVFGVDINQTREIINLQEMLRVPNTSLHRRFNQPEGQGSYCLQPEKTSGIF